MRHCAFNVALYGPGCRRWSFTEHSVFSVARERDRFALGPNRLQWDGSALTVVIDERTAPLRRRVRGRVRLVPSALPGRTALLDPAGHHRWTPIAPCARIEVSMESPALRWEGDGYLDSNSGDAPLERDFSGWSWSRARTGDGTTVLYDVARRDGSALALALAFDANGSARDLAAPPLAPLPATRWRIPRAIRCDPGDRPRVVSTLEDTPFYARTVVATRLLGAPLTAVHESLSLDRFATAWVRTLLPFRIRRHSG